MRKVLQSIYHSVLVVQMKNWEPLVFGPEFAIESVPAETDKPTSKSIKCDVVNKILASFSFAADPITCRPERSKRDA